MTSTPAHRLLLSSATRAPAWLVTAVVAAACGVVGALLLPAALAAAVDTAIAAARRPEAGPGAADLVLTRATVWLLALALTVAVANALSELAAGCAVATGTAWLRHRLARHQLQPVLPVRRGDPGDAVSRLVGDAAQAGAAPTIVISLTSAAIMSVGALIWLAMLGWQLAVAFLVGVPVAVLLARRFLHQTAGHALHYQRSAGQLSGLLTDAAAGLRTIAACNSADRETSRVLAPLPQLAMAGRALWRSQSGLAWRAGLVIPAVELGVLAAAGDRLARGELTVGQLLAAAAYAALGLSFLQQAGLLMRLSSAAACARRLCEAMSDAPCEPGWHRLSPGPGRLELREVSLSADVAGGEPVALLRDVTLTVPAGATVAVVGLSGSGKSALAEVAGGLRVPDTGEVLLDGWSLAGIDPDELIEAVGYAPARPALHGATVAGSLCYGDLVTYSQITAAARTAQVHEPISRLPEGYRTPLAQLAVAGGELQRLGLARALLHRPACWSSTMPPPVWTPSPKRGWPAPWRPRCPAPPGSSSPTGAPLPPVPTWWCGCVTAR
ncbi:MAG: ATP-binding cassette domain-containing protein [Pseudonocardiaceae bacterium]|nr:ATP-binding cassette domain-containing protein [Pseudonocardiaceae bacterium]